MAQSTNWSLSFDDVPYVSSSTSADDKANALLAEDNKEPASKLEIYRIQPNQIGSAPASDVGQTPALQAWQLNDAKTTGIGDEEGIGFRYKSD